MRGRASGHSARCTGRRIDILEAGSVGRPVGLSITGRCQVGGPVLTDCAAVPCGVGRRSLAGVVACVVVAPRETVVCFAAGDARDRGLHCAWNGIRGRGGRRQGPGDSAGDGSCADQADGREAPGTRDGRYG